MFTEPENLSQKTLGHGSSFWKKLAAGFFKHENLTGLAKSVSEFKDKFISARQAGPEQRLTRHDDGDSDLGSSIANSSESSDEDSAPLSP